MSIFCVSIERGKGDDSVTIKHESLGLEGIGMGGTKERILYRGAAC